MSLIRTYSELASNQQSLDAAWASSKARAEYAELVRLGKVLLPFLSGDKILFGPSRFLGYQNNTISKHLIREERDGKKTNPKIAEILRSEFGFRIHNVEDESIDAHFMRLCDSLGVKASRSKRTYWITPDVAEWLDSNGEETSLESKVKANEGSGWAEGTVPETTRRAIIAARVGQGLFRRRVLTAYKRCLVTGLSETPLLIASHIKPWRDCRDDPDDCLNPDNALLLSPHWDALFDKGYISFADDGSLLVSSRLSEASQKSLGVEALNVSLSKRQRNFLIHHRSLHGFE